MGLGSGANTFAYAKNNPLRYIDRKGLETTVIITFDYGLGSHAALYVQTPGQPNYLYDPAGSYDPGGRRGSGGVFEGDDANLQSYIDYQESTGSTVETVTLPTTPEQENQLKNNADEIGDPRGFSCANAVSSTFDDICGIAHTSLPGTLYEEALKAICQPKK